MDEGRKKQLSDFVAYSSKLKGDEKGEAQVFIDRLFRAFSRVGYKEAGAELETRVRNDAGGTSFADCVWRPHVLIEMKKRGEDLSRHLTQAFNYWARLVPNRPRYVVLCNFDEFRVYDFDKDIIEPQDTLTLAELPERYGPLNFFWPTNENPVFRVDREKVTREAADLLAAVYRQIHKRRDVGQPKAQRFVLQCLICLFSEDIGLLPKHFFTQLLDECIDPPKAFDLLDGLFRAMNTRGGARGGRFKEVEYFNGGIFSESAAVELDPRHEIALLKSAATYNWAHISPDIFGTIFQHSMDEKERHAFGAHYTSQADIMKIVGPTIVQPFAAAIERADSLKTLTSLRDRLTTLRVLDPACGSGNFLYIAYREMRRLEAAIILKQSQLSRREATGQAAFAAVSPRQFFGMDILPFAVELAKVTLSIAPKLSSDELHTAERTLPLDNLDNNIRQMDALIAFSSSPASSGGAAVPAASTASTSSPPIRTPWPPADIVIGNPPFLGAKRLKPEHGSDYVNAVRKLYPEVPGMADYCVYWFRRAHDHLKPCTPEDPFTGRAGLVGTQNIRNNQSRVGGLDHIVKSGVIVEAVENQPWSGEANVHVSIANWVKLPSSPSALAEGVASRRAGGGAHAPISESSLFIPSPRRLWSKADASLLLLADIDADSGGDDATVAPPAKTRRTKVVTPGKRGRTRADKSYEMAPRDADHINSALSDQADVSSAQVLAVNTRPPRSFQGVVPGYKGFLVSAADRRKWHDSRTVVRPFMVGRDMLTGGSPSRFIVDFADMDLLTARQHAFAWSHVEHRVLPAVAETARKSKKSDMAKARADHLERWWQFWNVRTGMRRAFKPLARFMACARVTKRPVFVLVSTAVLPDGALQTFAFDDDYSFGILQSNTHWRWFVAKCSKLTERFRYTPESVFDTFPWPQAPAKKQIRAVAAAGREIRALRDKVLPTMKGGLRALYRLLELPGKSELKDAHAALDGAVLDAYGFSPRKDLLKQILDLNLAVAARIDKGEAVTAPGVPPSYGDASDLVTDDCIKA